MDTHDHLRPDSDIENVEGDEADEERAEGAAAEEGTDSEEIQDSENSWVSIEKLAMGPELRGTILQINTFGRNTLGFTPYDWQAKTTAAVISGNDVACIARTGDGKSAVFQLLACRSETCHIIISPLIGLIDAQVT